MAGPGLAGLASRGLPYNHKLVWSYYLSPQGVPLGRKKRGDGEFARGREASFSLGVALSRR
jgi:hypothetical protein